MRAYNNRNNGRSGTSCGYCREAGHAISDCPHIKYDHDEWAAFRVPHRGGGCKSNPWFLSDYSYWIKQVYKYYPKWVAAQERKANKGKPRAQRSTAPKKCGFCGDTSHNRRNCSSMDTFREKLNKANAAFRQSYYNVIVKELGLGIGAAVKVMKRKGYSGESEEVIGIIDEFDLSELNMFSTSNQVDYDYRGEAKVFVSVGSERYTLNLAVESSNANDRFRRFLPRTDNQGREIYSSRNSYWNSALYTSTVAPSEQPLDESWVSTGAMANEFEWLTKKRSLEWLNHHGIVDLVDRWQ